MAFLISRGQTRSFEVSWDLYTDYGSKDVAFLRLLEIDSVGNVIDIYRDSIDVNLDRLLVNRNDDDQLHFLVMVAVDSSKNESGYSNIVLLDFEDPIKVKGFRENQLTLVTKMTWENKDEEYDF